MSVHDQAVFPEYAAYGTASGPTGGTEIIQTASGFEVRTPRVSNDGRHRFSMRCATMTNAESRNMQAFVMARNGSAHAFMVKDPRDYTSHQDGVSDGSVESQRQILGSGNGQTKFFQLRKGYASGSTAEGTFNQRVRFITRPIPGTVRLWVDTTELTIGSQFLVDFDSGFVWLQAPPAVGTELKASFEFYKPCVIGPTTDEHVATTGVAYEVNSATLELLEIVDKLEGREDRPAGYTVLTVGADRTLRFEDGQFQEFFIPNTSPDLDFTMWTGEAGGPWVTIHNNSLNSALIRSINLYQADGTTLIGTVAPDESATMWHDGTDWFIGG